MDSYTVLLIVLGALVVLAIGWAMWDDPRTLKWERRPRKAGEEPSPPVVTDYSEARQRALEQLGDRYLLAKPINQRLQS